MRIREELSAHSIESEKFRLQERQPNLRRPADREAEDMITLSKEQFMLNTTTTDDLERYVSHQAHCIAHNLL